MENQGTQSQNMEKKQSGKFFINLFRWKMNEEELKRQVENYNTLGLFQSARKVAATLFILSVCVSIFFIINGEFPEYALIDTILFAILAIFIYKGKKIAMIIGMILWTIEKIYLLSSYPIIQIIWWTIYMGALWQAYQVEKARASIKKSSMIFCRKCGAQIESDSKFCVRCGEKIISDNQNI